LIFRVPALSGGSCSMRVWTCSPAHHPRCNPKAALRGRSYDGSSGLPGEGKPSVPPPSVARPMD